MYFISVAQKHLAFDTRLHPNPQCLALLVKLGNLCFLLRSEQPESVSSCSCHVRPRELAYKLLCFLTLPVNPSVERSKLLPVCFLNRAVWTRTNSLSTSTHVLHHIHYDPRLKSPVRSTKICPTTYSGLGKEGRMINPCQPISELTRLWRFQFQQV